MAEATCSHRLYQSAARLGLPVRRFARRVVQQKSFEVIMTAVIVCNSIVLACFDPLDLDDVGLRNQIVNGSEPVFSAIYTAEAVLKLTALGLVGHHSYFADRWNWLDFFIVVMGWVSYAPNVGNVSALRIFRVLRPIKTLASMPRMRIILTSVLAAIPGLVNVFMLVLLSMFAFAQIGLQLWRGVMLGQCGWADPNNAGSTFVMSDGYFDAAIPCALACSDQQTAGDKCTPAFGDSCPMLLVPITNPDGVSTNLTMTQLVCASGLNPDWGQTSWDNMAAGMLNSFVLITTEGWTSVMYNLWHTWGLPQVVSSLFSIHILLGSCFLLELTLAVIWDQYEKASKEEMERVAEGRELAATPAITPLPDETASSPHEAKSSLNLLRVRVSDAYLRYVPGPPSFISKALKPIAAHPVFNAVFVAAVIANVIALGFQYEGMDDDYANGLVYSNYFFVALFALEAVIKLFAFGFRVFLHDRFNAFDLIVIILSIADIVLPGGGFSALRALRILKLVRSVRSLRKLMGGLLQAVSVALPAMTLLSVVMFIFALLGMQLFGGGYDAAVQAGILSEIPRLNFNSLGLSLITVFDVMDNENWDAVLKSHMAAFGWGSAFYFLAIILIGNYLFLNLFVTILMSVLEEFADTDESANPIEHLKSLKQKLGQTSNGDDDESGANKGARHTVLGLYSRLRRKVKRAREVATCRHSAAVAPDFHQAAEMLLELQRGNLVGIVENEASSVALRDVGRNTSTPQVVADSAAEAVYPVASPGFAAGDVDQPDPSVPAASDTDNDPPRTAAGAAAVVLPASTEERLPPFEAAAATATSSSSSEEAPSAPAPPMLPPALPRTLPPLLSSPPIPPLNADRGLRLPGEISNRQLRPASSIDGVADGASASTTPVHVARASPALEVGSGASAPRSADGAGPLHIRVPSQGVSARTGKLQLPPISGHTERVGTAGRAVPSQDASELVSTLHQLRNIQQDLEAAVSVDDEASGGDNADDNEPSSTLAIVDGDTSYIIGPIAAAQSTVAANVPAVQQPGSHVNVASGHAARGQVPALPLRSSLTPPHHTYTDQHGAGAGSSSAPMVIIGSTTLPHDEISDETAGSHAMGQTHQAPGALQEADGAATASTSGAVSVLAKRTKPHTPSTARAGIDFNTRKSGIADRVHITLPTSVIVRGSSNSSRGIKTPRGIHRATAVTVVVTSNGGCKVVPVFNTIDSDASSDAGGGNGVSSPAGRSSSPVPGDRRKNKDRPKQEPSLDQLLNFANRQMKGEPLESARRKSPRKAMTWCCGMTCGCCGTAAQRDSSQSRDSQTSGEKSASAAHRRPSSSGDGTGARRRPSSSSFVSWESASETANEWFWRALALPSGRAIDEDDSLPERTLFLFSKKNWFRRMFLLLKQWFWFEQFMLVVILISCINLALDEPRLATCGTLPSSDPSSCAGLASYLSQADVIITWLFTAESIMTIICNGVIANKQSYFRDGWSILDAVVVCVSISGLYGDSSGQVKSLRSLRAFRALRALRMISRFPALRLVIDSIIVAMPRTANPLVVLFLFIYVFATIGLSNFSGGMFYCNDPTMITAAQCQGTFIATADMCRYAASDALEAACRMNPNGMALPRVWRALPQNFDNIASALLTMFELLTGENWPVMMTYATDITGEQQPQMPDANLGAGAAFFIMAELVLNMFLIELFTGVVIDTYLDLRKNSDGMSMLTDDQKLWVDNMRIMLASRPTPLVQAPASKNLFLRRLQAPAFRFVTHVAFEMVILACIVVNCVFMSLSHYGETQVWIDVAAYANMVFTAVFTFEAVVKMFALGLKQYSGMWWNRFDFVLVVGSILSLSFEIGAVGVLFKVFRIARVVRLIRFSKGLSRLLRTLILSLPSLANVMSLLFLTFFVFAVVGMNIFSGVRVGWMEMINGDANFNSFGIAYMTMIRCSTGENFNGIMRELMGSQPPYCIPDGPNANCGTPWIAAVYWIGFFVVCALIMLNLLVAIVMESFDESGDDFENEENKPYHLTQTVMEEYRTIWNEHDVYAAQFLDSSGVVSVIASMRHPLGVLGKPDLAEALEIAHARGGPERVAVKYRIEARKIFNSLPLLPDAQGRYHFHALLHALMAHASGGSPLGAETHAVELSGGVKSSGIPVRALHGLLLLKTFMARKAGRIRERRAAELTDAGSTSAARAAAP